MRYNCLLVLLGIWMCFSCSVGKESDEATCTLYEGYDDACIGNADLPVDSFDVIPLETTAQSLLSYIRKVEWVDSLILIQDAKERLYGFDRQGKFKYAYGSRGIAPGEYLAVTSFYIDHEKQQVNIIDEHTNRIYCYDMTGCFISERKFPVETFSFVQSACLLDSTHVLCSHYMFKDLNVIYSLVDLDSKEKKELYRVPMKTDGAAQYIGVHPISECLGDIKCIVPFDDKVYSWTNGKLIPDMLVSTNKPLVPAEQLQKMEDYSPFSYADWLNKGFFVGFTSVFETSDYIVLTVMQNSMYFIIDKKTQQGKPYISKKNHISHLPLIQIYSAHKDWLVGVERVVTLQQLCESVSSDAVDDNLLKLKNKVLRLATDDNDCILLYKLR